MTHRVFLVCLFLFIASWYKPMSINAEEPANPTAQANSSNDPPKQSKIENLTRDKNEISGRVEWWNSAYIIALVVALVVGSISAFAQLKTIRLSKDLVSAQSQIDREKDRIALENNQRVASDLKKKDLQIAQLDLERTRLQERLLWEEPRSYLLSGAQSIFVSRLSEYRGQKYETSVCFEQAFSQGMAGEPMYTENALMFILKQAGWERVNSESPRLIGNCSFEGIFVHVKADAPRRTQEAGMKLKDLFSEILREESGPVVQPSADMLFTTSDSTPHNVIEVRIGRHPLFPTRKQHTP
jgi:hypothetical protein